MHAAELNLDKKVQIQQAADKQHSDDLAALDSARSSWSATRVRSAKLAASVYMGGRTDGLNAMLTAASPQGLIDKMAVQRVMATEMSASDEELPERQRGSRPDRRSPRRSRPSRPRRPPMRPLPCGPSCSASSPNFRSRSPRSSPLRDADPGPAGDPGGSPEAPPAAVLLAAAAPDATPATDIAALAALPRPDPAAAPARSPFRRRSPGSATPTSGAPVARRLRLLRPGDVVVPAGRHLPAALQLRTGGRRPAGVGGRYAAR